MLQVKSSDSVKTISLKRTEVLKELGEISARIAREHPEVLSIRLFGSIARSDHTGTSDADILIVLRSGTKGDPIEWIRSFYAYFRLPVPVDVLVYSEEQVASRIDAADPQFTRLWTESIELRQKVSR